jgi:ABC-type lipoprotein export system ATPase subunit/bifunctional DNA-binding transcriptional regulator/antitoxin component of YhaV-PrlF toxin-antitoxin module
MTEALIRCENLVKIYKIADLEVVALQGLDLEVRPGELLGIVGASGSGKSTLLNILGGLDRPSAGRITVGGRNLLKLSDRDLDRYRRNEVGFVWQQSGRNLIPYLTARENVELPMTVAGMTWRERRAWSQELLEMVDLWDFRSHRLSQLSGGQQQRIAIATALANRPALLLGDEPTGEVDRATAQQILALFKRMNEQIDLTTIIVTHDPQVTRVVDRVLTIRDGRTSSEAVRRVAEVEAELARGLTQESASDPPGEGDGSFLEEYIVVDAAGRLQIPPNIRQRTGIGERVTLEETEDGIVIRPVDGREQPMATADTLTGRKSTDGEEEAEELEEKTAQGLLRWLKRRK